MKLFAKIRAALFSSLNARTTDLDSFNDLVVRARRRPEALIGAIRAAMHAEDPNLAIANAVTLSEALDRSFTEQKLLAKLAGFCGILALLFAALGLYGVIAYSVARRGTRIGLPIALACGRFIASQLYEVKPGDPWSIGTPAAALAASFIPARRAALLDPLITLREE